MPIHPSISLGSFSDVTTDQHKLALDKVHELLENVLRSQVGEEGWARIDSIHKKCVQFRQARTVDEAERLQAEIRDMMSLPLPEQLHVIRSFSYLRCASNPLAWVDF